MTSRITNFNKAKTHCKHGHPLAGSNLKLRKRSSGLVTRTCRECERQQSRRWKKKNYVPQNNRLPAEARFWARVEKSEDCWNWKGPPRGTLKVKGKPMIAYRFSYEMAKGPIPAGLTIDHLCMNPRCVRPDHLEAVTMQENQRRAVAARLHVCSKCGHKEPLAAVFGRGHASL